MEGEARNEEKKTGPLEFLPLISSKSCLNVSFHQNYPDHHMSNADAMRTTCPLRPDTLRPREKPTVQPLSEPPKSERAPSVPAENSDSSLFEEEYQTGR